MKNLLGLVFILILFLTGCTDKGTLKIVSNSNEDVWYQLNYGITKWIEPGDSVSHSWNLSTSIFGEEDKKVTITYGGGEGFLYESHEVLKTIKPDKTVDLEIIEDR